MCDVRVGEHDPNRGRALQNVLSGLWCDDDVVSSASPKLASCSLLLSLYSLV